MQFYARPLQPLHPSHLIVSSSPNPRPLRATLRASYHRILRGLLVRSDDLNAPPLIIGGVLEEGVVCCLGLTEVPSPSSDPAIALRCSLTATP